MAMNFALPIGLAQTINYEGKINDLHYNELAMKRVKDEQEAKAKMFADDTDYTNAMNSFDSPKVKEFARAKIKEIGAFVNANPDWQTNVSKRIQYKQLVKELKDNEDLKRGLASDKSYDEYQKDLAEKSKHPELLDADAYKQVGDQWDNYTKFGNQFAKSQEEADKLGRKSFVYTAPKDFADLTQAGLEYGNKFKDFDVKPLAGGGLGSYEEIPKEDDLNASTTDFYKRNEKQINIEAQRKGLNPFDYAQKLIRAGINGKRDYGDYKTLYEMNKDHAAKKDDGTRLEGNYHKDIANTSSSTISGDLFKDMLGAKPPLLVKDNNGNTIDLTGHEVEYPGYNVYFGDDPKKGIIGQDHRKGIKNAQVRIVMSKEEAFKKGIADDKWWPRNDQIKPEWTNKAHIETKKNEQGKDEEYVVVDSFIPFNVNTSSYQGLYDTKSSPNKSVESPKDNYLENNSPKEFKDAVGNIFDANGKFLRKGK